MPDIPNTVNYMILGYVVILGIMALYLGSLFIRNRNLHQDIEMLKELDKDQK